MPAFIQSSLPINNRPYKSHVSKYIWKRTLPIRKTLIKLASYSLHYNINPQQPIIITSSWGSIGNVTVLTTCFVLKYLLQSTTIASRIPSRCSISGFLTFQVHTASKLNLKRMAFLYCTAPTQYLYVILNAMANRSYAQKNEVDS